MFNPRCLLIAVLCAFSFTARFSQAQQTMPAFMKTIEFMSTDVKGGHFDAALEKLRAQKFNSIAELGQTGEFVLYTFADAAGKDAAGKVLDAWDVLAAKKTDLKISPKEMFFADLSFTEESLGRAKALALLGRQKEAGLLLKAVSKRFGPNNQFTDLADALWRQVTVVGKPAADLKMLNSLGDFHNVSALRGKVVMLDFFAHWCMPCKHSFPELREFYADLKPKGLELIGVTTFYGYYGKEQKLTQAQEYEKMKGFVPELNVIWPIAFADEALYKPAYGVAVIPHVIVIDKKGIVRLVEVGYHPEHKAQIRAFLEKLLLE